MTDHDKALSAPPAECENGCPPQQVCDYCQGETGPDKPAGDDGTCVRCGAAPRNASGLCATCLDEDAERAGEIPPAALAGEYAELVDSARRLAGTMEAHWNGKSSAAKKLNELCAAITAQAGEIERLTGDRDDARALLAHTREWNTDWLLKNKERTAAAEARVAELETRVVQLEAALRDTLDFYERHSNRWDGINGKHPALVVEAARAALSAPAAKGGENDAR